MKKKALAISVLLVLACLLPLLIITSRANPAVQVNTNIQIESPSNSTYTDVRNIPLNVIITGEGTNSNYSVSYRIFGINPYSVSEPNVLGQYFDNGKPATYNSTLTLQEGEYSIEVSVMGPFAVGTYNKVYFTVQTNLSPSPTIPELPWTTLAILMISSLSGIMFRRFSKDLNSK